MLTDKLRIAPLACFLLFLGYAAIAAESPDSSVYPARRPSKQTWERVVSFPGQLAYAPVRYSVLGLGSAGVYVFESGLINRLEMLLDGTGVAPTYAPRTGAGATFFSENFIAEKTFLLFTATTWHDLRQLYELEWRGISLGSGIDLDGKLRYRALTAERFYGVGPDSRESDEVIFAQEDALFELSFYRQLSRIFRTQLDVGVSNTSVYKSRNVTETPITDLYRDATLPGLTEKVQLQGTEFALYYKDSNHPGHPTAGRIGKLGATLFSDIKDNRFGFWKYSLDLTQHLQLFNERVLALRVAGELTENLDLDIPFYHLAEFGSHETIRGFSRGRFRDKDMLLASAEYRYPIWIPWERAVDAVLFIDTGQVAGDIFKEAAINDLRAGYGGGLRFYGAQGLLAQSLIGVSKEGFHVYLTLNQ